nr:alpha/beta hydrolase [Microlunatus panaciterrae]
MPGLGLPGYLAPWARVISEWTRATVLDLPGWRFGRRPSCSPTLQHIAIACARWLEVTDRSDVILLGHSTGAQAVLRAALLVPQRIAAVVLAGPTFAPGVRTMPALLRTSVSTFSREVAAEFPAIAPSVLASGMFPLARFIRSAMPDRPEELVPQLASPVMIMTGEHDGLAPPGWAAELARLVSAPLTILPGAHNACFPFPRRADQALREFVAGLEQPAAPGGASES